MTYDIRHTVRVLKQIRCFFNFDFNIKLCLTAVITTTLQCIVQGHSMQPVCRPKAMNARMRTGFALNASECHNRKPLKKSAVGSAVGSALQGRLCLQASLARCFCNNHGPKGPKGQVQPLLQGFHWWLH